MGHTPGPWKCNRSLVGGDWVISTVGDSVLIAREARHFNAPLIAAAPELEDVLNTLPPKTVRVIDGREYITFDYAEFANWDAGKRLPALDKATGI